MCERIDFVCFIFLPFSAKRGGKVDNRNILVCCRISSEYHISPSLKYYSVSVFDYWKHCRREHDFHCASSNFVYISCSSLLCVVLVCLAKSNCSQTMCSKSLFVFVFVFVCVCISLYVWQRAIVERRQLGRNLCSNSNKLLSTGPCGQKRPEMLPLKKWPFYFVLNFFLVCMT